MLYKAVFYPAIFFQLVHDLREDKQYRKRMGGWKVFALPIAILTFVFILSAWSHELPLFMRSRLTRLNAALDVMEWTGGQRWSVSYWPAESV